jgi:hypothetical protein
MKRGIRVLLLFMTVLSTAASAAQSPPAATTLSMRGTISQYDDRTRTLSLSTPNGTVQLPVSLTTRIRRGSSRAEASELQKLTGNRATVRYTETGDRKIVKSIHVFEDNQRRAR